MAASATLRLNAEDNVVVARVDLAAGAAIEEGVAATASVPSGHKVAVKAIAEGEVIRKYDQIIGFAASDIAAGDHVHIHNCVWATLSATTQ